MSPPPDPGGPGPRPAGRRSMDTLCALLDRRRPLLALFALAAAALVPGLLRLDSDNSPEAFFLRGSREVDRYRELRRRFGSDEAMRVVASGPGLWTAPGLTWLGAVEAGAAELAGVEAVAGLWSHHRPALGHWPPADPLAFQERVTADPLDRGLGAVGAGGGVATALVVLAPAAGEEEILDRLRQLAADPPPGVGVRLVGPPVLAAALDGSSREILRRFFPLLVLLAMALLAFTLREPAGVLLPLAFVGFCELALLGIMGYAGVELNLVLAVLPPLLFVVALATAVHLMVRARDFQQRGARDREIVLETYRDKGWAVLWTGITTLAGFGSLAASRVGPVRSLGLWSALGLGVMIAGAFSLFPLLLEVWARHPGRPARRTLEQAVRRAGGRVARGAVRRRGWVLVAAAVVAAAAVTGLPRLSLESNALNYLPEDDPARAGIEDLEARGIGSSAVELVLTLPAAAPEGEGLRSPEALERLSALAARLRQEPLVLGAVGAGDLVDAAGRALPPLAPLSPLAALEASPAGARQLGAFLTPEGDAARLTLFCATVGFDRLKPLLGRIRERAAAAFPRARVEVTGQFLLLLEAQRQLFVTLGLSLSITLACVAAILRLLLGTTRLTLLALAPTVLTVLAVMGGMGWSGTPLDVATVMVASVLLGLAVDLSIHTLGHFRDHAADLGRREAVAGTLERASPAFVLTGAILILGFGVCALSSFAPTARFGLLAAAGIALAVLSALVVLPALLGAAPAAAVTKLRRPARAAE